MITLPERNIGNMFEGLSDSCLIWSFSSCAHSIQVVGTSSNGVVLFANGPVASSLRRVSGCLVRATGHVHIYANTNVCQPWQWIQWVLFQLFSNQPKVYNALGYPHQTWHICSDFRHLFTQDYVSALITKYNLRETWEHSKFFFFFFFLQMRTNWYIVRPTESSSEREFTQDCRKSMNVHLFSLPSCHGERSRKKRERERKSSRCLWLKKVYQRFLNFCSKI